MEEEICPKYGETNTPVQVVIHETVEQSFKKFRDERIFKIVNNTSSAYLEKGPKIVFHLSPFSSFGSGQLVNLSSIFDSGEDLHPLYSSGYQRRFNFEGVIAQDSKSEPCQSYLQIFREGGIEFVEGGLIRIESDRRVIPSNTFEEKIIDGLSRSINIFQNLGIEPPLFIALSLLDMNGFVMGVATRYFGKQQFPIREDKLLIQEIILEDYDIDAGHVMKPIFDIVWNANGWEGSINYSEEGEWRSH